MKNKIRKFTESWFCDKGGERVYNRNRAETHNLVEMKTNCCVDGYCARLLRESLL